MYILSHAALIDDIVQLLVALPSIRFVSVLFRPFATDVASRLSDDAHRAKLVVDVHSTNYAAYVDYTSSIVDTTAMFQLGLRDADLERESKN